MSKQRLLQGVGVSPGLAIGPVRVVHWEIPAVTRRVVAADQVDREIERLRSAIQSVRGLIMELRVRTLERAGEEEAKIFDAQMLMVEDEDFLAEVEILIRENQLSAERAFEFKTLEMRALWAQSSSSLLRQRVADLAGLQVRVLNELVGQPVELALHGADDRPVVVFTRELTPGLTVQFERAHVAGFASEEGTRTSHAVILARSMGIPCVVGVVGGLERVVPGMEAVLDGTRGTILVDPSAEELEEAKERERLRRTLDHELERAAGQPAVTADGNDIILRGNVDLPEELDAAVQHGAAGVGLLRTEFLILGRTALPTEDEQAHFFTRVATAFPKNPVTIRSYDLGGDKFPAAFRPAPEPNPFLGWRAIRVCLDEPEMFLTQIRAILRARAHGDVQLMLPLVTQIEELDRTRELVAEAAEQLQQAGVQAAGEVPVGVMIETPAAAMLTDQLAEKSDFLSVGTNDLTQYMLAVDRGNARMAGRFAPLHPAVIRALQYIRQAASRVGVEPSVCGEMATEPVSALLLLGLGYRVLSVAPPALLLLRWLVRKIDVGGAQEAAEAAASCRTTADATAILHDELGKYVDLNLLGVGRLPGASTEATLNFLG